MRSNQSPQLLRRYCILCVDHDRVGLEARAALLEAQGYSVTAVRGPLMALECLDFPCLLFNGFQLLLRLRAARASFPIVLLSGMSRKLPNDMRTMFSSCHDNSRTDTSFLNTVRSYLAPTPAPRSAG